MDKRIPSYEEFRQKVKDSFWECRIFLKEEEVDEYLLREENETLIRNKYKTSIEKINNGEMTILQMMHGAVGAVAYCLYMLW